MGISNELKLLLKWYVIDDLAAKTDVKILFYYGSRTLLDAANIYTFLKAKQGKAV